MKRIILITAFLSLLMSCNPDVEQTVETAFVDPNFLPDNLKYKIPVNEIMLRYKFSRNGISNVDYLVCDLIKEPLDIVQSRLVKSRISSQESYDDVLNYYENGLNQVKPIEYVVTSELQNKNKEKVKQDIIAVIDKTAEISGFFKSDPTSHRNREATPNNTGYIGYNIGNQNASFVNEKGLIISEVFRGIIIGGIYLDKILYHHLDEGFFDNEDLRRDHENVVLLTGRNYTVLEHHWDLAYGYFNYLQDLSQPNGIPALKYSEQKLYSAFVQGRIELNRYRYDDMKVQLNIIRKELSKVIAIRTINYLTGPNTMVNLKEASGSDAFTFLSKAYGLIYAIQFTRNADGNFYFTYDDVQKILQQLEKGTGFWDKDRLLGDETVEGSLDNIAKQIAKPFDFTVEEVKR